MRYLDKLLAGYPAKSVSGTTLIKRKYSRIAPDIWPAGYPAFFVSSQDLNDYSCVADPDPYHFGLPDPDSFRPYPGR